jgi:hypothetical protein
MLVSKDKNSTEIWLTILFFTVVVIEVTVESLGNKPLLFIFKPLISILLMILYWNTSVQKNQLFFIAILFSLITNAFFIPNTEKMLFIGLLFFFVHRILMIYYIVKLTKLRNYIPLCIAVVPFIFLFFYLLSISTGITSKSYVILIIQNVLISIIGGIAVSDYVMNDVKKSPLLLIFGLVSVTQYFIVFIEKYYLSSLAPSIFRPLAMTLNIAVYYIFYKYVIDVENSNLALDPNKIRQ